MVGFVVFLFVLGFFIKERLTWVSLHLIYSYF